MPGSCALIQNLPGYESSILSILKMMTSYAALAKIPYTFSFLSWRLLRIPYKTDVNVDMGARRNFSRGGKTAWPNFRRDFFGVLDLI